MSIYSPEFQPTYLYIKQHSITGKLYFGKTIRNPEKYTGSGTHWTNHIKFHGKEHVVTIWYCLFHDAEAIKKFALTFSEQQNIVESTKWLNKMPENGLDNCTLKGIPKSIEHRAKMSAAHHKRYNTTPRYKISKSYNMYDIETNEIIESEIKMDDIILKYRFSRTSLYRNINATGIYKNYIFEKIDAYYLRPPNFIESRKTTIDSCDNNL